MTGRRGLVLGLPSRPARPLRVVPTPRPGPAGCVTEPPTVSTTDRQPLVARLTIPASHTSMIVCPITAMASPTTANVCHPSRTLPVTHTANVRDLGLKRISQLQHARVSRKRLSHTNVHPHPGRNAPPARDRGELRRHAATRDVPPTRAVTAAHCRCGAGPPGQPPKITPLGCPSAVTRPRSLRPGSGCPHPPPHLWGCLGPALSPSLQWEEIQNQSAGPQARGP